MIHSSTVIHVDVIGCSLITWPGVNSQNHGESRHQFFINYNVFQCKENPMVFWEDSITNTPQNRHALCAADSLKVIIQDILHEVNILGDLALGDHQRRIIYIVMEYQDVPMVFKAPQGIIVDFSQNHLTQFNIVEKKLKIPLVQFSQRNAANPSTSLTRNSHELFNTLVLQLWEIIGPGNHLPENESVR